MRKIREKKNGENKKIDKRSYRKLMERIQNLEKGGSEK